MVPALLAQNSADVRDHHLLGASTGCFEHDRGNWPALVDQATAASPFAVELTALSERELPSLTRYLADDDADLPFRFVSVHAPTKHRRMTEHELIAELCDLPAWLDAIVVHPDAMDDLEAYAAVGCRLVIENMDARKQDGRTAAELERFFEALPDAGFCFDVAHAWSIDPSMREGQRMLDRYACRLRHLHVSSLAADGHHLSLSDEHEELFGPLLSRCHDVPWIFEAPLTTR
jgi:sugar phosphate isomerase/epimerase